MLDNTAVLNPQINPAVFDKLRITIAAPEKIRAWSSGEIKKPETINYRTFKPEKDGLFCAKIFGPVKDYECLCGKYKRMKHKGITCEKCGVEVTLSKVRRERMGHIELATPVAHIWFLKSLPSRIGLISDIKLRDLEKVLYFESFIVTEPGTTDLSKNQLLSEDELYELQDKYGESSFEAMIGAEAIKHILSKIDIEADIQHTREELKENTSETKRKVLVKRLTALEAFKKSDAKPEHMVLEVLPVIPPDLRPLVPLEGGRFATSDLNDLYRRVINRNNRLHRLKELRAPEIIIRNEKRMLQEAVDALFDNGRRGKVITGTNKRPLKSLADMLKGKHGRFRQNLLGKRVDYSGRSVIVVGPELKLHQCGLPKKMALELFKPFIMGKLQLKDLAPTIKAAKKLIEKEHPAVWDILEEVIREHPVLLNRAPTLHRLGIQAFEPVLVEGKAIQLHPLVCTAFNADFDGDQMAVHVPISLEAQLEARVLMMATNNILSPANGKPIIVPSQDIVLGLYYITTDGRPTQGYQVDIQSKEALQAGLDKEEVMITDINGVMITEPAVDKILTNLKKGDWVAHRVPVFATISEIQLALDTGAVQINSKIRSVFESVDENGKPVTHRVITTVGRMILSEILPRNARLPFSIINKVMTKKEISNLIDIIFRHAGQKETVIFADKLMGIGFSWACRAGISFGKDDLIIPKEKDDLVQKSQDQVKAFEQQYQDGLITQGEKYNKVVDIWSQCSDKVADAMMRSMMASGEKGMNSVYMMAHSGARGSAAQIKQLAGMRGLMAKPSGEIIETPIISNFKEGLSVLEYFNSTHGARKGLADTALKTAYSGYFTRRLVDVAQDVIISEDSCGTDKYITIKPVMDGGDVIARLSERALGRHLAAPAVKPNGEVLFPAGTLIDEEGADALEGSGIDSLKVYSPLTCESKEGCCAQCYGRDLARGTRVNIGEAVGIIAAQSIGEPGTQLTMRTFHIGGAAQGSAEQSSIDSSLDGVVELIRANVMVNSDNDNVVMNRDMELVLRDSYGAEKARHRVPFGAKMLVKDKAKVLKGQRLVEWDPFTIPIIAERDGHVKYLDLMEGVSMKDVLNESTNMITRVVMNWKLADSKVKGAKADSLKPRLAMVDKNGEVLKTINGMDHYLVFPETILVRADGDEVKAGDIIARTLRGSQKNRDITGGLPRVTELFEARMPKEPAMVANVDGRVRFGKDYKQKRVIFIENDKESREYSIPKTKHLLVQDGDEVRSGDLIVDGSLVPHDILETRGIEALSEYMTREVQGVYRLQGVKIDDKHIEVITRQMMQKVEITNPGDTLYLTGEMVDRFLIARENVRIANEGGNVAEFKLVLQGITRASLQTDSFISSASFQETTRILTDSSVNGRVDELKGLKENIIVGRLIPAGTGMVMRNMRNQAIERDKFMKAQISANNSEETPAVPAAE